MKYRAIQNRQFTDKSRSVPKYVAHKPRFLRWNTLRREMEHAPPGDGTHSAGRWNTLRREMEHAPSDDGTSRSKNQSTLHRIPHKAV